MSRSYCFTLNNWTPEEEQAIPRDQFRYITWGKEQGEQGTPHLQGYLELWKPQRITAMIKLIPRAHFEARRGTREQARDYCHKDNDFTEYGDWREGGQGRRNDLKKLMEALDNPGRNILQIMCDHPDTYARNIKFAEKYQALREKEETRAFRTVTTELIIGEAGTGKSKRARELAPLAFTVNPEDSFPFDGYEGERDIIIDDFEGQLKYKHLLKILDGHQLRINVKGSHRYAKWTRIFITTNEEATNWYQRGLTPALQRRISTVTRFSNEETGNSVPFL